MTDVICFGFHAKSLLFLIVTHFGFNIFTSVTCLGFKKLLDLSSLSSLALTCFGSPLGLLTHHCIVSSICCVVVGMSGLSASVLSGSPAATISLFSGVSTEKYSKHTNCTIWNTKHTNQWTQNHKAHKSMNTKSQNTQTIEHKTWHKYSILEMDHPLWQGLWRNTNLS